MVKSLLFTFFLLRLKRFQEVSYFVRIILTMTNSWSSKRLYYAHFVQTQKKDFRWEINLSKSVLEQKKPKKFFEHLDFLWTFLSKKYTKQLFFWDLNLNCVRLISLNALQLEHSRKKNWEWSAGWLSILKGLSWKTSFHKFWNFEKKYEKNVFFNLVACTMFEKK